MLDEEMPNFPESSPQDLYQEVDENPPEQVQEFREIPDIQEVPIQEPQDNLPNQTENASFQPTSQDYSEDILLQSSLGGFDSVNTYSTQIIPNEIETVTETEIAQPIYQSAQIPINNIGMQNIDMNEYNNMNAFKSYSYQVQNTD